MTSPPNTPLGQSETLPIDFVKIAKRVFEEKNGVIKIGGEELKKEMRDLLREQAKYIKDSHFWEILHCTIQNEAARLALIDSKDWNHIEIAKMLHHWDYVFENMAHQLSKE